MIEKDALNIIEVMNKVYPEFSDCSISMLDVRVDLWISHLRDVDYEVAKENLRIHMKHSNIMPAISRINGNTKGYIKPAVSKEFSNIDLKWRLYS